MVNILTLIILWRKGELKQINIKRTQKKIPQLTVSDLEKLRQFFAKCRKDSNRLIHAYAKRALTEEPVLDIQGNDLEISKSALQTLRRLNKQGKICI